MIFVQDMRSRSVYWVMFPALAVLFFLYRLNINSFSNVWPTVLINLSFLCIQLILISGWFTLRNGKLTNITAGLLGWGDILFLISVSVALSVVNYLFFYIMSLTAVVIYWAIRQNTLRKSNTAVPLAGLQAFILAFVLSGDWWIFNIDTTKDDWFFTLIAK